ncbi:DUF1877 family protein [Streptomyces sp. HUAS MG47]|uniref:DUF1877 family protein n=1 Tax=Streptomyces solicamelliae TaxID=3231716 RepID=UPI003877F7C5
MSFHMHLRAVVEGEARAEAGWLETFMRDAWDVIEVEYAAGVAAAIEKDFGKLHELYEATRVVDPDAGPEWELPVYGGRVVYRSDADRPPFMLLGASDVRAAAGFLAAADFEALWGEAGAKLAPLWKGRLEPAEAEEHKALIKAHIRAHHDGLRAFYGRAAAAGHEVVKAYWY